MHIYVRVEVKYWYLVREITSSHAHTKTVLSQVCTPVRTEQLCVVHLTPAIKKRTDPTVDVDQEWGRLVVLVFWAAHQQQH